MRKYKHIMLSIDGTLIDTERTILQAYKDTIKILHKRHPKSPNWLLLEYREA